MIIDSSALVAILNDEEDAPELARAIEAAAVNRISAGTLLETMIVVDTNADAFVQRRLEEVLRLANMVVEDVTLEQVLIGRAAYRDFGRGSGHPAQLNYGDCFAYALAQVTGEPLLFKGEDFRQTDVRPALP